MIIFKKGRTVTVYFININNEVGWKIILFIRLLYEILTFSNNAFLNLKMLV